MPANEAGVQFREARAQFRGAGTIKWVKPRRLIITGRPVSLRLEDDFWNLLRLMAAELGVSATKLIASINAVRNPERPLSSTLRVAVASYWYAAAPHKGLVYSGPGSMTFRITRGRKPKRSPSPSSRSPSRS